MLRARSAVVLLLLGVLMTVLSLVPVGELQINALALMAAGGLFVVGGTLALANARRLLEQAMADRSERLAEAEERYRRDLHQPADRELARRLGRGMDH
jgi:hypothetical protein